MDNFKKYNQDNSPQDAVDTITTVTKNFGFLPNLIAHMAGSPVLIKSYMAIGEFFSSGSLTATEQQVVLMTINRFHECRYCMAGHTMVSEMTGVDMAAINAIRDDQPIGNQKLGALRGFTLAMVEQRGKLSQAQFNVFFDAGYTEETVLEIIAAAAYKTMSNYTNHIVGTVTDAAFINNKWSPINER
ncbi:carboxymuconolactone decarboxylase family protein [Colwellia psychrerythraea]|uniref:Carboxymuconolactone decarboxylase n=1 Tax=Colwellia psychrerythraea TaxID=28229 RepID=A0A099KP89_COLPS|nr:carboxymuconolactone decarboxylase family protein [Colwellia psychrerythraea]KGJ91722.1 hypothetical protein GAB14E_3204 [Colwellia psychrerythraea]